MPTGMCALPDSHREDSYLYARHKPYIRNETQGLILESKGNNIYHQKAVVVVGGHCVSSGLPKRSLGNKTRTAAWQAGPRGAQHGDVSLSST